MSSSQCSARVPTSLSRIVLESLFPPGALTGNVVGSSPFVQREMGRRHEEIVTKTLPLPRVEDVHMNREDSIQYHEVILSTRRQTIETRSFLDTLRFPHVTPIQ